MDDLRGSQSERRRWQTDGCDQLRRLKPTTSVMVAVTASCLRCP